MQGIDARPDSQPSGGGVVLEAREITKHYGHVNALESVSLQLHEGECLGLIGDNGAGKSTLVKILSGALTPTSGDILIDEMSVDLHSPHDAREKGIETVYQDLALAGPLTAWENIFLGRERTTRGLLGRLGWLDRKPMRSEAEQLIDRLRAEVRIDHPVESFSGGQRQAVALARAIAWEQRALLLDEPTAALGVRQTRMVMDLIRTLRSERPRLGVVLISHNMQNVLEITDRVAVLRLGRVSRVVKTADTTEHELVSAMIGA